MNVLAMDTSNDVLGLSIVKNGIVAGELMTNVKKNHSIRLMPAIDQLMRDTQTKPEELDRIAVAHGPGSYTGVRIGLTTAKTMAWSLGIPVVGISSLKALASQGRLYEGYICPFFDARRGLVYTGLYDTKLNLIKEEANLLMSDWLASLKDLNAPILFLSQDTALHKDMIEEYLGDQAVIADAGYHYPSPSYLALAAMEKEPAPLHELVPNYLRIPEAEAKWLAQQEKR
ncbi:tRNA (adenosine(37)-N6)-threonylcarbamoyltransferase complex dimerization subunit type 1 TsaB [Halobacillus sp. A1]|uniref:tRNA (adenosine(37)-N6)-threonylcarbamoyltransferase complex dimerization subunit type 1 TsaB n=1 Tax=Halobacillus sp. A1 TaxID=2880262 RepID=UPI0020A6A70A|nr:tRNA (adenosine(37)-N6)-threonylcarbamoyltransferase complex dimerization subunit type 1 TsaB [Halobacillus sp. A1]MCP3032565.1 tRNA (adenosine(37)-N6)-threonylcarbamoyltransferase complex dimerization subunit type 1 TsaB [Halobacillus sp. A1]